MLTWMTNSQPWEALPAELAEALEPELPAIADEILRAISQEVPEYARPFEGAFGHGVRTGVTQALQRFLALMREPGEPDPAQSRVYIALGRQELRAGRTLDALQSAYRVGARVAWRRIADVSADAGFDHDVITRLAEAIFAYIDELSAESVEGYARAQSELAGERERLQNALVAALLRAAPAPEVAALAEQLSWTVPRAAAALACRAHDAPGLAGRLGPEVVATVVEGAGCLVVPDATGPGRAAAIRAAAGERPAALGPELPLARLPESWRLAAATLGLRGDARGVASADEHLSELLVAEGALVVERIARRRLAAFEELTPKARERMLATALAFVQQQGNAAGMARALHIHPQTARYRINGLRKLLGDQLDDPDARFELEAALRSGAVG
jgi:PucR-like helix-turn-helix protein